MKTVNDLSLEDLQDIVSGIQEQLFRDLDDNNNEFWNSDKEVSGGDFVESAGLILDRFGLVPETVTPFNQNTG